MSARRVDKLIRELSDTLGVTSIVVTHDLDTTFDVGDRIALLYEGRIRACARPAEILENPDPVVQRFVRRLRVDTPVTG